MFDIITENSKYCKKCLCQIMGVKLLYKVWFVLCKAHIKSKKVLCSINLLAGKLKRSVFTHEIYESEVSSCI